MILTTPSPPPLSLDLCFDYSSQQRVDSAEFIAVSYLDYCVEHGVTNSRLARFNYVHNFFESQQAPFTADQAITIALAAELFGSSTRLGEHEAHVLSGTLKRLVKSRASLPGRK
jgi:hypothetical protein